MKIAEHISWFTGDVFFVGNAILSFVATFKNERTILLSILSSMHQAHNLPVPPTLVRRNQLFTYVLPITFYID